MNISKLLVLPVLFITSIASAESVRVQATHSHGSECEEFDKVIDFNDNKPVVFENEDRKVECVKAGNLYTFTISVKKDGEWQVVCAPEIVMEGAEAKLETASDEGSSFSMTLEKVAV